MIARYGRAIEYDLAGLGMDLAIEWRRRRWRRLLSIIDRLPRTSAYVEALANDEDLARQVTERERGQPEQKRPSRRMSEWSPDVELLSVIANRLGDVVQAIVVSAGGKPHKVPPMPHPVTAFDRVRRRRTVQRHRSLVDRVIRKPGTEKPPVKQPPPT